MNKENLTESELNVIYQLTKLEINVICQKAYYEIERRKQLLLNPHIEIEKKKKEKRK